MKCALRVVFLDQTKLHHLLTIYSIFITISAYCAMPSDISCYKAKHTLIDIEIGKRCAVIGYAADSYLYKVSTKQSQLCNVLDGLERAICTRSLPNSHNCAMYPDIS